MYALMSLEVGSTCETISQVYPINIPITSKSSLLPYVSSPPPSSSSFVCVVRTLNTSFILLVNFNFAAQHHYP